MTPEQEIRAVAVQAAAAFCAPISNVHERNIPNVENVLFVADVFYGYVQGGWEEALRIHATSDKTSDEPSTKSVELRERRPVQDAPLPESVQPEQSRPSAKSAPPAEAPQEKVPSDADVIPIQARGVVTKEQVGARRYFDKMKRERAEHILKRARVAKAQEHKERLREDAEESGLLGVLVEVDGTEMELGQYLASL